MCLMCMCYWKKDGFQLLESENMQLLNPKNLRIFYDFRILLESWIDYIPMCVIWTIILSIDECTYGFLIGDSLWNQTTLGVFWETLVVCLVRFWLGGVGSFNFRLRKRSSKLDCSSSTISMWSITLIGSSLMMGSSVKIGSVVWVGFVVCLGYMVFTGSLVCIRYVVSLEAQVHVLTILDGIDFLFDFILVRLDFGLETGLSVCSVGLDGVERHDVVSFIA